MRKRTIAQCEWAAGVLIGLLPIMAHALVYVAAEPNPAWENDWSPDILFVTISNSGICVARLPIRCIAEPEILRRISAETIMCWLALFASLVCAAMLYGVCVSDKESLYTLDVAVGILVLALVVSWNYEMTIAAEDII